MSRKRDWMLLWLPPALCLAGLLAGCPQDDIESDSIDNRSSAYSYGAYGDVRPENIVFNDFPSTNDEPGDGIVQLVFQDTDGKDHPVSEFTRENARHVVLVVTRGNTNPICPFCTTQTARLIKDYAKIQEKNAEVVLIYPVERVADKSFMDAFLQETRKQLADAPQQPPFPVLLDLELKGVTKLGIRQDLSKPATYIIDRQGHVRFAYVGADRADRPSVQAILSELDEINKSQPAAAAPESP